MNFIIKTEKSIKNQQVLLKSSIINKLKKGLDIKKKFKIRNIVIRTPLEVMALYHKIQTTKIVIPPTTIVFRHQKNYLQTNIIKQTPKKVISLTQQHTIV